jgi:SAM-dependent methyltransferase
MASMDWSTQSGSAPATYQEFLVPAMFAPFTKRLVEHGYVRPGSRVLDVACGTGVVSRAAAILAGGGGSVAGVDQVVGELAASGFQIGELRRTLEQLNIGPESSVESLAAAKAKLTHYSSTPDNACSPALGGCGSV